MNAELPDGSIDGLGGEIRGVGIGSESLVRFPLGFLGESEGRLWRFVRGDVEVVVLVDMMARRCCTEVCDRVGSFVIL